MHVKVFGIDQKQNLKENLQLWRHLSENKKNKWFKHSTQNGNKKEGSNVDLDRNQWNGKHMHKWGWLPKPKAGSWQSLTKYTHFWPRLNRKGR